MRIFIPTYGRSDNQVTWNNIPHAVRFRTHLVVQEREEQLYDDKYPLIVLPDNIFTIGATRQWLVDNYADEKILMLDDDLDFAVRRSDEPTKFRAAFDGDILQMLDTIQQSMDEGFKMVGVSGREGANRDTSQFKEVTRQLRIHALDAGFFKYHNIRFDRIPYMEDFDATLQLLELGYPNRVLNGWVHNQRGGSNAPGGCSTTRTIDAHNEAAKRLHMLHPKYVRVVHKESGNWGDARLDVNISWKKAYEHR